MRLIKARIAPWTWVGLLVVYLGNGVAQFPSGDVVATAFLPFSILRNANFFVGKYVLPYFPASSYFVKPFHHHLISSYPIGAAVTATPFYVLYAAAGGQPSLAAVELLQKLSAAAIVIFSVYLFKKILEQFNITGVFKIGALLMFSLGSETMSISSQGLWQHGPAVMWYLLGLYALLKAIRPEEHNLGWLVLSGFSAGMVLLTRPVDVVLVAPIFAWVVLTRRLSPGQIGVMVLGGVVPVAGMAAYNAAYYGSALKTGYGTSSSLVAKFSFPLLSGVAGNLFSPSKGWVIYDPLLFVFVLGAGRIAARAFWASRYAPLVVSAVLYLVIYAKFYQWPAGYGFGPRYETDLVANLTLLSAGFLQAVWPRVRSNLARVALIATGSVLLVWSVGIQLVGTYASPIAGAWITGVRPNTFLKPLWSFRDAQFIYAFEGIVASYQNVPPIRHPKIRITAFEFLQKPYLYKRGVPVSQFAAGALYRGKATVTNESTQELSAFAGKNGTGEVHFSYLLFNAHKQPLNEGQTRTALLHSLAPGQSETVYFWFSAPSVPGVYYVVFTMVQEGVAWFSTQVYGENGLTVRMIVH